MPEFVIAAAQIGSVKGEIAANVANHARFVRAAIAKQADMIVFPELSLTGYEPDIAAAAAIDADDARLSSLKELAREAKITIVAGAPLRRQNEKPYISALLIAPTGVSVYIKNHLHPGEEAHFSAGEVKRCVLDVDGTKVGLAICADIGHASHAAQAAAGGAAVYAAGVLVMGGYAKDTGLLAQYAREHAMAVLMANYGHPTGGYVPAGKSAVWDNAGNLLACAPTAGDALVFLSREDGRWTGKAEELR